MRRPVGVTILAILAGLFGAVSILAGCALLALTFSVKDAGTTGFAGLIGVVGIGLFIGGIPFCVLSYGAWKLRPWAWPLALVVAVLHVGASFALLRVSPLEAILGIAIFASLIYYLWQPHVRRAFGQRV
ncbi:MAG TPA: hypothetical protein VF349_07235 [Candidatus Limnocylindrales bacterium]